MNKVSYRFTLKDLQDILQATQHSLLILSKIMRLGIIYYASSYFKYKTPTSMRGLPTHKSLKRLKSELQANVSSIETDLGGRDHGNLGLVIKDVEHATVPQTQTFVVPSYPNTLKIPSTATAMEELQRKDDHSEAKRIWLE